MRPEDKSINLLLNLQHSIAPRQDFWLGIQERTHTKSLVIANEIKALIIFSLWTFHSKRWVIVQMHGMPNSAGSQTSVLTRALKHALIHNCTHIDYTWLQPIFVTFCRASSKVWGTRKKPHQAPPQSYERQFCSMAHTTIDICCYRDSKGSGLKPSNPGWAQGNEKHHWGPC